MSVATSNAFALLDDEGTMDVNAMAARLPAAPKPVTKPAEETKPVAASRPGARDAPRGGRGGPGGRGPGGRGPRGPARGDDAAFDAETAPAVRAGRGAGAGARGPRGPRRTAEGDRPGRRTYDRHDGTGRGHEIEKRRGTGRGNWGSEVDPAAAEGVAAEPVAEAEPVELTEEEIAAAEAARLEREAEEKQMSLADFEAAQAAKKEGLNAARSAAYVPGTEQFAGMTTMPKPAEDRTLELTKNAKVHGANKGGRDKELKQKEVVLDVGFKIASSDEPRRTGGRFEGGRGGRGGRFEGGRGGRFEGGRGGRGGRFEGGRGRGPAAPKAAGAAINVDDTAAFPSLS